jgi:BirA family transcriptional regulator, biotin operon repressor / biotin---[acetyl-CoA-carboxylase] ligase
MSGLLNIRQGAAASGCDGSGIRAAGPGGAAERPDAIAVAPLLATGRVGRALHYRESTGSTNADACAGADSGCADGAVYCAGSQTGGRGRMDRRWFSPPGVNLYFSVVLRPGVAVERTASLPLVAGLAVAAAVAGVDPSLAPQVKWPNDIMVKGKKICGILCEMQTGSDGCLRHIIAGVGVNVNLEARAVPEELRATASSLRIETGRVVDRAALLAEILNGLEWRYDLWRARGFAALTGEMERCDALYGRDVAIRQGRATLAGKACGVQDDGALKVATPDGVVPVYSGEATVTSFS